MSPARVPLLQSQITSPLCLSLQMKTMTDPTASRISPDDLAKPAELKAETPSDQQRHHAATRTFELDYNGSQPGKAIQTGVEGRSTLALWLSEQAETAQNPVNDSSDGTSAKIRLALFDLEPELWTDDEVGSFGEALSVICNPSADVMNSEPTLISYTLPTLAEKGTSFESHSPVKTQVFKSREIGMALKYYPQSRTTIGVFEVENEYHRNFRDYILENLETLQILLIHPSLLALLALQVNIRWVEEVLPTLRQRVMDAQKQSGFHNFCGLKPGQLSCSVDDFGHLSGLVSGEAGRLAECEHRLRGLQDHATLIRQENEAFGISQKALGNDVEYITRYMEQKVDFSSRECTSLLYETQSWQRQASIVVQGIFNLIAQRDQKTTIEIAKDSKILAEESRRDNISMKAIAAVTMSFLPGTYLAVSKALTLPSNRQASLTFRI